MTEREREHIETPERTHDQPAEGGREEADKAAEHSPATGPEGIDSTSEGLEDRYPRGTEPPN
jgi:hypothetical protein